MRGTNTVLINGRAYDARTGRPTNDQHQQHRAPRRFTDVVRPAAAKKPTQQVAPASIPKVAPVVVAPKPAVVRQKATTHASIHGVTQKSQTLHRAALKKPVSYNKPVTLKSPQISRFGTTSQSNIATKPIVSPDKIQKAQAQTSQPVATEQVSAAIPAQTNSALKEQLIKERISEAEARKSVAKATRPSRFANIKRRLSQNARVTNVLTASVAVLLLGGYLTYINMPGLSLRVAAAQAGIQATMPEYRPEGYAFGPVTHSTGEVKLAFVSNSNAGHTYEITERSSAWDSQAVLDNMVTKENSTYLTYSERGLTVYTYGQKAAWVNGGILYTLDSKAPLNSDQILKIASSM